MTEQILLFLLGFFVICLGLVYGLAFLLAPGKVATKVRRMRMYAPILDAARTKSGRIQLRIMGLIFTIASLGMAVVFVSSILHAIRRGHR